MYQKIFINKDSGGWGKGLLLQPTDVKNKVVSMTGGGIHPVAAKIAELSGTVAIDGFNNPVPEDEMMCVIIDCGGTARIGVYPMKKIPTVDIIPSAPSGPLAKHITEDVFVSGVTVNSIVLATAAHTANTNTTDVEKPKKDLLDKENFKEEYKKVKAEQARLQKDNFVIKLSKGIGKFMGILYQAGRDTIDMLIKNILPFMCFVCMLIGIINYTGIGNFIANHLSPYASTLPGMLGIVIVCTLPFLSPILGPGAVISQVIGVLIGSQIAIGAIPVQYALPALFAINGHVGCDFVPVGLSLGEAKQNTIQIGVPAVLYSRMITGVLAVVIAWFCSFGMY